MTILSIETSCDETAVSVVQADGEFPHATYEVLGNALFSQIDIHREYGGVFPMVAKREHAKTLVPMLERALSEAGFLEATNTQLSPDVTADLHEMLYREATLGDSLIGFLESHGKPPIDLIAVTSGPGLEPTLWVGINFAHALASVWNAPVVPVNHMEGHIMASIFTGERIPEIRFPALALLVSGGHTELDLMRSWGHYECVGETRDDAVGEAFDKVARMFGLPYPGGPEVGARAAIARERNLPTFATLPRPMLDADNLDFSFSGLKTAVRYAIAKKKLSGDDVAALARDFEDAAVEVLVEKSRRAVETYGAKTLIVGGGVSANALLRERLTSFFTREYPEVTVYLPPQKLSTDNSVMIALAGHANAAHARSADEFGATKADGNLSLDAKA
ncbi:MAG TPA: tRNA (adenosine(37)-N6)-threonylcarbamoyltransferase complex transferase subunit TsaD [Candidatus Paceibacterota bacterium]|nr:tRNA (adenosine(37)-N6)-threonylcarbamoyltransferase complex transferase subunit TsaD [Candidatus Paceibacterota bacterium]